MPRTRIHRVRSATLRESWDQLSRLVGNREWPNMLPFVEYFLCVFQVSILYLDIWFGMYCHSWEWNVMPFKSSKHWSSIKVNEWFIMVVGSIYPTCNNKDDVIQSNVVQKKYSREFMTSTIIFSIISLKIKSRIRCMQPHVVNKFLSIIVILYDLFYEIWSLIVFVDKSLVILVLVLIISLSKKHCWFSPYGSTYDVLVSCLSSFFIGVIGN